jgi:hypothetical protein
MTTSFPFSFSMATMSPKSFTMRAVIPPKDKANPVPIPSPNTTPKPKTPHPPKTQKDAHKAKLQHPVVSHIAQHPKPISKRLKTPKNTPL